MIAADDTDLPVSQSRVDRESGRRVDGMIFGCIFVFAWSVEAIETGRVSVSFLLGVQLMLKISGTGVLIFLTSEEVEMVVDVVVFEGLNGLLVLASVFSAEAWEEGMARLVPVIVTRPWGVDSELESVFDAKDEVVPIT